MKKAFSMIMLMLLLMSTFTLSSNISLTLADNAADVNSDSDLAPQKINEQNFSSPTILHDGSLSNKFSDQGKLEEGNSRLSSRSSENWNFSEANKWVDFVKVDNVSMEIVVGLNYEKPNSYDELKHIIAENDGELVNTISVKGKVQAAVGDIPYLVRKETGKGATLYLNLGVMDYGSQRLSPQGNTALLEKVREVLASADVKGNVTVRSGGKDLPLCECIWRKKGDDLYLLILKNVAPSATPTGEASEAHEVDTAPIDIEVTLAKAARVTNVRTGKVLGEGAAFTDTLLPYEANIYRVFTLIFRSLGIGIPGYENCRTQSQKPQRLISCISVILCSTSRCLARTFDFQNFCQSLKVLITHPLGL